MDLLWFTHYLLYFRSFFWKHFSDMAGFPNHPLYGTPPGHLRSKCQQGLPEKAGDDSSLSTMFQVKRSIEFFDGFW